MDWLSIFPNGHNKTIENLQQEHAWVLPLLALKDVELGRLSKLKWKYFARACPKIGRDECEQNAANLIEFVKNHAKVKDYIASADRVQKNINLKRRAQTKAANAAKNGAKPVTTASKEKVTDTCGTAIPPQSSIGPQPPPPQIKSESKPAPIVEKVAAPPEDDFRPAMRVFVPPPKRDNKRRSTRSRAY